MSSNTRSYPYRQFMNVLCKPLEVIREKALADACEHKWYNQTLCKVNESVVRLGVVEGEYHWHQHDQDDEFFYVVEGHLLIDYRESPAAGVTNEHTIELRPREGVVIPKAMMHRPRAPQRTVLLMVETSGIVPTGS